MSNSKKLENTIILLLVLSAAITIFATLIFLFWLIVFGSNSDISEDNCFRHQRDAFVQVPCPRSQQNN